MAKKMDARGFSQEDYKIVENFIQDYKSDPSAFPDFENIIYSETAILNPTTKQPFPDDEATIRRLVEIYVFEERSFKLGSIKRWRQTRIKRGNLECRYCAQSCYVKLNHPSLGEVWEDVKECALSAAALTTLLVIYTNPSAAEPAFIQAFVGCLKLKGIEWANEIYVKLEAESNDCEGWSTGCGIPH